MHPLQKFVHTLTHLEPAIWQGKKTLARNEFLKTSGSKDTNLYLVQSGCFRLFVEDEKEEHTIRLGYQGDIIAALDSFIADTPSPFFIQALKKSEVLVLPKTNFVGFVESDPNYAKLWQEVMGFLIQSQIEREIDILCSSPVERYRRLAERSPRLFQEIPHKYIAAYLRMTPETLSRILKS